MKCPKCGLDTPGESNFCNHCGAPLNAQAKVHAAPVAEGLAAGGGAGGEVLSPAGVDAAANSPMYVRPQGAVPPERVIWDECPSLKTAIPILCLVAGVTVALLAGAHYLAGGYRGMAELVILALGGVVFVLAAAVELVRLRSMRYKLSTQRFFLTRGLINKRTDEIEIEKYKDIFVNQDFWDKMVGCGDIEIVTADVTNPTIKIIDVRDPVGKKEAIRNAARERKAVLGIMRREEV